MRQLRKFGTEPSDSSCCWGWPCRLQGLSIWIAHLETPSGTLASPFGNYTAVLPLGITPLLPQLAPAIILPTLLVAAATRIRLPPVLLTAASAGKELVLLLLAPASTMCFRMPIFLLYPPRLPAMLLKVTLRVLTEQRVCWNSR